jgi:hypothetical protein
MALDILTYLADRPSEVIAKQELMDHIWSDVTVEEGSLRVHFAAIRKALRDGQFGNRYIASQACRCENSTNPDERTDPAAVEGHRGHAAAARSSLSAPRMTILSASSSSGRCSALASSHSARIQTPRCQVAYLTPADRIPFNPCPSQTVRQAQ